MTLLKVAVSLPDGHGAIRGAWFAGTWMASMPSATERGCRAQRGGWGSSPPNTFGYKCASYAGLAPKAGAGGAASSPSFQIIVGTRSRLRNGTARAAAHIFVHSRRHPLDPHPE